MTCERDARFDKNLPDGTRVTGTPSGAGSVSLAVAAAGPAWRTQRLLALTRPYVDEIVLAGDEPTLDACGELADVVLPPAGDDALQRACRGDWIVRLHGGDVPSGALLGALRELTTERRLTHLAVAERWLYRDVASYLASPPWQPRYGSRILRRAARGDGERRLLDLPVYRSELLLEPERSRRLRALAQERLSPDALRGGAPESALLVPEDWDGLALQTLPRADRATVAHLLERAAAPPAGGTAPAADRDRPAGASAGAPVAFVRPVTRTRVDVAHDQEVEVLNVGDVAWPWRRDGEAPVRLGYRWRAAASPQSVVAEGPRTHFTETVEPGARSRACMRVEAPSRAGRYVLEVDVVEEHVRWLGHAARLEVTVEDAARGDAPAPGVRGYLAQALAQRLPARAALRDLPRWARSQAVEATPLRDGRAWLTFAAQAAFERALRPGARVCEFGCGGSTRAALEHGAELLTIEWDADWAERVAARIAPRDRAAWTLDVVALEADERAAARDPSDPRAYVSASPAFSSFSFGAYARAIDRCPPGAFDVVLVAGRARPSCLVHALPKVAPGGLVILDHSERPWYEPALAACDPAAWARTDHVGPGPYAAHFWQTTALRRSA